MTAQRRFALLALFGYIALVAFVAAHHEPWRDEADSWLLTRDGSLREIVTRANYGGAPLLWYALVAPLAKSGMPYASQTALNLLFAIAAAALLLFQAPLPRTTKLLIVFSYYLAYEYAVIARPYALSVALLFACAALYPRRLERPVVYALLLALAMNTNPQAFVIAAVLAALFVLERRDWRTIAILAVSAFAMFVQVRPAPGGQRIVSAHAMNTTPYAVGNAFLPSLPLVFGTVAGAAVLVALFIALRRNRAALFVLAGSVAGLLFLFTFVWIGGYRHAGFLLIGVIVAVWIAGGLEQRAARVLLDIILLMSCLIAARAWRDDITMRFTGAREMGLYIRAHGIDRDPIAAHNLTQCEAVLPYLDAKVWYAGLRDWGSYMPWDRTMEEALDTPYPLAVLLARTYFRGHPRWHLLLNVEMPDPARNGFRLVYATKEPVYEKKDERYWLYEPVR